MIRFSIKQILSAIRAVKRFYFTRLVKFQAKKTGTALRVNGSCYVSQATILGNNVNFNGMRIQGNGPVTIGDNFHSGTECLLLTESHNYEGEAIPYDTTVKRYQIDIEDNVWLGNRVIIAGNVCIGEGAIIQAGSVVVSDIPKYGIAGGHPAKVFKYRDAQHYEQLKSQGKFH